MINQVLGQKDTTNRRKPEEVETADFTLACDTVVAAIGQQPDIESTSGVKLDRYGMVVCDPRTGATNIERVFAGGDVNNVATVIAAIAAGKRSACSIDQLLAKGQAVIEYEPEYPVVSKEAVLRRTGYFKDGDRLDLSTMDGKTRINNFSTYTRTLTEEEAVMEASRCLNCGCGEGCGLCATICSEFAIHLKETDTWEISNEECAACGMCYNRCPNKNIEMINRNILVK
jgi:Pyruvate/2-oxoacid:ferredoxin oxidoreductase delta subunit